MKLKSMKYNVLSMKYKKKMQSLLQRNTLYPTLHTRSSSGFTLIETFVAITILVTAIAGPLTIASKGLQSAILAKDQLTASFLAQEGIEYIREVRDNNCLQIGCTDPSTGVPVEGKWLTGLESCTDDNGNITCQVDASSNSSTPITQCSSSGCDPLYYDDTLNGATSGFYSYNTSGTRTSFVRSIQIIPINAHEATITSRVDWKTGPFSRFISVAEVISDWQ